MVNFVNYFDKLHIASSEITDTLQFIVEESDIRSERTGDLLHITSRRFRYTTGTRAAREGFGELGLIAVTPRPYGHPKRRCLRQKYPRACEKLDEAVDFN